MKRPTSIYIYKDYRYTVRVSVGILGGTIFNKSSPRHLPRRRRCGSSHRGGTSNKDSIRFLLSYSWTRGRRPRVPSWKAGANSELEGQHTHKSFVRVATSLHVPMPASQPRRGREWLSSSLLFTPLSSTSYTAVSSDGGRAIGAVIRETKAGAVLRCTVYTRQKTMTTVKTTTLEWCRRGHTVACSWVLSSRIISLDPSFVFLVVYHALSCSQHL